MNLFKFINLNRTFISPFLFLYKSQYTSIFSIFMRVSGFIIFLYYFFLILKYINNIFFIFNIYNIFFDLFTVSNNILFYIIFIFMMTFILYHIIFGIRYIFSINYWNNEIFKELLNLNKFYTIGFFLIILTFILIIFTIF